MSLSISCFRPKYAMCKNNDAIDDSGPYSSIKIRNDSGTEEIVIFVGADSLDFIKELIICLVDAKNFIESSKESKK